MVRRRLAAVQLGSEITFWELLQKGNQNNVIVVFYVYPFDRYVIV